MSTAQHSAPRFDRSLLASRLAAVCLVALMGAFSVACSKSTSTSSNVIVTVQNVHEGLTAAYGAKTLVMTIGGIVPIKVVVVRQETRGNDTNETRYQGEGLLVESTDARIANIRFHENDIFVVTGAELGRATIELRTASGDALGSFDVEIVPPN